MAPSPSHLDRLAKHVSERWEANRTHFETEVRGAEHFDLPDPKDVASHNGFCVKDTGVVMTRLY